MTRVISLLSAVALAFLLAVPAGAEKVFTVNDTAVSGVFDQPNSILYGTTVHLAYIAADSASGPFTVRYAAIDGTKDFQSALLTQPQIFKTAPVTVVDSAGLSADNVYYDARHPKILARSSTEIVIVFSARPIADDTFQLFLARLTLSNDSVSSADVRRIDTSLPTRNAIDPDVAFSSTDNTLRVVWAESDAAGFSSSNPYIVKYARVGIDNGLVVASPITLSSGTGLEPGSSDGYRPLPYIGLDAYLNVHVAWAATRGDNVVAGPNGLYYAMLQARSDGTDNVAIAATAIFGGGGGYRWTHPHLFVQSTTQVYVVGVDESFPDQAGSLGWVQINPIYAAWDNTSAYPQITSYFLVSGLNILPETFNVTTPSIRYDNSGASPIVIVTGYGNDGAAATTFAFSFNTVYPFADFVYPRTTIGLNQFPAHLAGDFTKAAFSFLDGRIMAFWSGLVAGSADDRFIFVSTAPSARRPPNPENESGCTMAPTSAPITLSGATSVVVLLSPAIYLLLRRRTRPGEETGVRG